MVSQILKTADHLKHNSTLITVSIVFKLTKTLFDWIKLELIIEIATVNVALLKREMCMHTFKTVFLLNVFVKLGF